MVRFQIHFLLPEFERLRFSTKCMETYKKSNSIPARERGAVLWALASVVEARGGNVGVAEPFQELGDDPPHARARFRLKRHGSDGWNQPGITGQTSAITGLAALRNHAFEAGFASLRWKSGFGL